MRTKLQTIQSLIDDYGYKSYLEVGLGDGKNFRDVRCDLKYGVDPDDSIPHIAPGIIKEQTSDVFFSWYIQECNEFPKDHKMDLIFIDGLHHSDQVERDIKNAWECLNKKGIILIHDIKPQSYEAQIVPRQQKIWNGDVWRVWSGLKKTKLNIDYIPEENGLGVIYKSRHKIPDSIIDTETTFEEYFESKGWRLSTKN